MMNLTELSWTHDGLNTDGTPFTEDQFAGFTLHVTEDLTNIGRSFSVSVPASWNSDGVYSVPLADLLPETGDYSVTMTVVSRNGQESEHSEPLAFSLRQLSVPSRPFGLSVS